MTALPILHWPDPVLSRRAAEVTVFDAALGALAQNMLDTMYAAPGRGLAGPQIGVLKRIFVMDVAWKDGAPEPLVVVNPVLSDPSAERVTHGEGCLSIPGLTVDVARPAEVTMTWQDLAGAPHRARLTGFAAICAQHEADHLDGVLTLSHASPAQLAELEPQLAALRAA